MSYDDQRYLDQTYGNTGPGAVLNTISFVGIALGFLLIANRLYWRWKKGIPGADDIVIVFAWIALLALGIITYLAVNFGYGRPSSTLTRREVSRASKMFYLYQIFYKLTLNLSKLSILTLYLRVFDTRDWFGKITKSLIVLVIAFTSSIVVANVFICSPIPYYWDTSPITDPSHKYGKCINVLDYWYASSLYNILSEALMLFSVLIRIWTLPSHSHPPILQFRQKVNLTFVLGLGVFTVITAILRVTTLNQAAMATDRTGGTLTSTKWSSIEACVGLAVANLPMLRQLLRWRGWCGGHWFGSSADKSRSIRPLRSRGRNEPNATGQCSQHAINTSPGAKYPPTQYDATSTEIHVMRHFRREVVTSDSESVSETTRTLDTDVESQNLPPFQSQFNPYSPVTSPCGGASSLPKCSAESSINSVKTSTDRELSIVSTLHSPTQPLPVIRISTDPSSTTSLASVTHI